MNNENILTLTPDEFAARFAPAAAPDSHFIRIRETGKLELHFDKVDYEALTDNAGKVFQAARPWAWYAGRKDYAMKYNVSFIRNDVAQANLATVLLSGIVVKIPVTAPDRRRAMEEDEGMIDDCGFLLDLFEA